jgi:hypothetical protein
VLFELSGSTYNILHTFCLDADCKDGLHPLAGVTLQSPSNVLGTTTAGGKYLAGTVFEYRSGSQAGAGGR